MTVATLSYARMWREELKQESVIVKSEGQTPWIKDQDDPNSVKTIEDIEVLRYRDKEQLDSLLVNSGIDALYVMTSGVKDKKFANITPQLWIHAVFPSKMNDIHGNKYACISDWLAKESFNYNIPFVPHIVNFPTKNLVSRKSWLKQYNIPQNSIIIGSMGGTHTFDLKPARDGLERALHKNPSLFFVALNHRKFTNNKQSLFLPGTNNLDEKSSFINACDAMLHGRAQGETFGLACAEYAAANKPIFAWRHAPERHHLEKFCPEVLNFSTARELEKKLLAFDPRDWSTSDRQQTCLPYRQETIAPIFQEVFAKNISQVCTPDFSIQDKALIFKRRIQRSLRARLSQSQKYPIDPTTVIEPTSGFPMEN
ncbi:MULTISPECIES: hypothetical protein [unclassified Synechococcus]|uniref:hypothetical protein n=1 Tax=unclassified Synechococcus TaxID=2626047 RepID=UPI00164C729D|nr:hypothetical protein [Synechococcus sp. MIT S9220]